MGGVLIQHTLVTESLVSNDATRMELGNVFDSQLEIADVPQGWSVYHAVERTGLSAPEKHSFRLPPFPFYSGGKLVKSAVADEFRFSCFPHLTPYERARA